MNEPFADSPIDESIVAEHISFLHSIGLISIYDRQPSHYFVLNQEDKTSIVNIDPDFMLWVPRLHGNEESRCEEDEFSKEEEERRDRMTKVKWAVTSRRRKKKVLKRAKGQVGGRSRLYRTAKESVQKGMAYSYRDRKRKKREFRALWIARINAACKEAGISYSRFMASLKKRKIMLNRKMLADIAVQDKKAFREIVKAVQG